ncbi:hypothetical protein Oweho_3245 [Owenweeksia hongkongensis DSM 17368]|uniref:Uncharacterized protein n=1 Tax=Owenweeksia hongkongensis (strain DSM 17368 / CIP 108786 / JCM 12287 / NRRL B-23963 / UST20020801) TaxID=926562 RepID=G8R496_OWEHD|nr:hypothetical protein Oweho_3245 [Owenweeksia hongkongensis DSM 17368]
MKDQTIESFTPFECLEFLNVVTELTVSKSIAPVDQMTFDEVNEQLGHVTEIISDLTSLSNILQNHKDSFHLANSNNH